MSSATQFFIFFWNLFKLLLNFAAYYFEMISKLFSFFLVILALSLNGFSKSVYSDSLFIAYLKSDMILWKSIIDKMQVNELNHNNVDFTAELVSY